MDQTLVKTGHDVELVLGPEYLRHLLFLLVDSGDLDVVRQLGGDDPDTPEVEQPVEVRLETPDLDRTYAVDPEAIAPGFFSGPRPLEVEVLFDDPDGADLRVTPYVGLRPLDSTQEAEGLPIPLYVRLGLETTRADDGIALSELGLRLEFVRVDPTVVSVATSRGAKEEDLLAGFHTAIDRVVPLGGVGSGGRLQDVAIRKLRATATAPAALGVYVDLVLRTAPQEGVVLARRGDTTLAENLLEGIEGDVVFATRPGLYDAVAADAFHRRAVPDGDGFDHPIREHPSDPTSDRIGGISQISAGAGHVPAGPVPAGPVTAPPVPTNTLELRIDGDVELDDLPDPGFTLTVSVSTGVDDEGVMSLQSSSDLHSGLLADLVLGVIAAALIPVLGGWSMAVFLGLELAKEVVEEVVSEKVVDPLVDAKVDATVLDLAPVRFTYRRVRWDPFYVTHHQLGLRPGGSLVTDDGMAIWGTPVLTRAPEASNGVVIRSADRDADGTATALHYLVSGVDGFRGDLSRHALATERGAFTGTADPAVFTVTVPDALDRVAHDRIRGRHPYVVLGVQRSGDTLEELLVLSRREVDGVRADLVAVRSEAVTAEVTAARGDAIRDEVLAHFADLGIVPSQEQVDEAVAAQLAAEIAAALALYTDGGDLEADLTAGTRALATFRLSPSELGRLQDAGLLTVEGYDLVHLPAIGRWYYRDHYVAAVEKTPALRLADNLPHQPRYRVGPDGAVVFD